MSKGKLIAIEGVDGSGKATQSNKLYERLLNEGFPAKKIHYPRYDNPSSSLVRLYLNGEFGDNAKDTNAYIASTFYAVDRYASLKQDYEQFYKEGGIVIADRYTTSNMIHQAGKISNKKEREKFLDWLWDFEFNIYKIPIPDLVFFLDVPVEFNEKIMKESANKDSRRKTKDIHERDIEHLKDSYNNACSLVDKYGWCRINYVKDGQMRTIEDIHNEIYNIVIKKLGE
jgi:dTMP kinase